MFCQEGWVVLRIVSFALSNMSTYVPGKAQEDAPLLKFRDGEQELKHSARHIQHPGARAIIGPMPGKSRVDLIRVVDHTSHSHTMSGISQLAAI